MHCLIRFNARLVPSDLSSIPVLIQASRLSARADMFTMLVDMPLRAESSGDLTSSDSDTFLCSLIRRGSEYRFGRVGLGPPFFFLLVRVLLLLF